MEKEQHDSMATVQMKADYAASEVYSTTSEPPPVSFVHDIQILNEIVTAPLILMEIFHFHNQKSIEI